MHTTDVKKKNYDEEMAPNRKTALGANLVLAKKNTGNRAKMESMGIAPAC